MEETTENRKPFVFQATSGSSQTLIPIPERLRKDLEKRGLQDRVPDYSHPTGKRTRRVPVDYSAQLENLRANLRLRLRLNNHQSTEYAWSGLSCQLCGAGELTLKHNLFCTYCEGAIKQNETYYSAGTRTIHLSCVSEYLPMPNPETKVNTEETKELWISCVRCGALQHQICALYNGRRNEGEQQEYICANCCSLPQAAVLGAKDLPRTILSDHIEQRLFKRLRQEKQERARFHGKSIDEIQGAEPLTVRVVSSVDKILKVKQHFLQTCFQEEYYYPYPSEVPYKSKVIMLFQKIEGVEVCLFGIHTQEFGSECQDPNNRAVYISYLDSVKYFKPEVRTVSGEALRTFVYHEILIGYLGYCKLRGFTSCHIWACPPLKDDDYIFHCHPEFQKTPKSDKLREWFGAMLQKASKENIVTELTNLYDEFFLSTGECKAEVNAYRLPYFDGDYWPGAAEDYLNQVRQEEDRTRILQGKPRTKMVMKKRALQASAALKASATTHPSANASKIDVFMQKLGETICPMKQDFIVIHLQHSCNHCRKLMVSGNRWVCISCNKFQLCDKCYGVEQKLEDKDKHPINCEDKHVFHPVEVRGVPQDTKDEDEILENEFVDTREAFLSLCQKNHYQFDTLRRAKHSSMMVLYHLHNPTAVVFGATCNMCQQYTAAGQIWSCGTCTNYDVCNSCYQKDFGASHPHPLKFHPITTAQDDVQKLEDRRVRVLELRTMLDLLIHASQCRYPQCQYHNCRKVKSLFRHGIQCKTRAQGGCFLCKKMWYLLQLHARACKVSECHVPRCRDLKEHMRRIQEQSDNRRRVSVMEMMKQRAEDAVVEKMNHLSVADAPVVDTTDDEEDYCETTEVVVDQMGHLSIAEATLLDNTMGEEHSVDDEWILL